MSPKRKAPYLSMPHTLGNRRGQHSSIHGLRKRCHRMQINIRPDLLIYGTKSTSYVPGARNILPEHSSYSEEQTLPGSSSRHDQPLPPPMVQGYQNRVMCKYPKCGIILKKENLTRHINEVHKRKMKARCDHCKREFTRPYLKKKHVCQESCRKAWNVDTLFLRCYSNALTISKSQCE